LKCWFFHLSTIWPGW